ncbi:hypothetical protein H6G74_26890 [Nostoc spongiaeforme FACHB-130]|uniref:DUF2808 domain-containing protein n=1 Tax=Nostoc spongiaeforme FACHB-130 TaxID=1357510 RepID=A0ABR8G421_9NOSO|nr:hypothetical protein [Nostoc spongiaeforme]MBD2597922.1 hypothetical protein [Nostoc spongiaeforme FACHB-130]
MKALIFGSLSALIVTTASTAIATPTKSQQLDSASSSQVAYTVNVPSITNSGVRNDTHFIKVAVLGMSVQDLMISLPNQMERFTNVRVVDDSGKEIAAKTEITKERLSIIFDQPIVSGTSVEVQLTGVQTKILDGRILLYGVTAKRTGLEGEIPVGTARIDLPYKNAN